MASRFTARGLYDEDVEVEIDDDNDIRLYDEGADNQVWLGRDGLVEFYEWLKAELKLRGMVNE